MNPHRPSRPLATALALAVFLACSTGGAPPAHAETVKQSIKNGAHEVKYGLKRAGKAIGHAATETGHAIKRGAKRVKHAIKGDDKPAHKEPVGTA
jgi:hypothetical protein